MNWTEILAAAGIPEPPGREEAIEEARRISAERIAREGPKRARGSSSTKAPKWSRAAKREAERKERLRNGG